MYSFFTQEKYCFFVLFVCNIEFVVSQKNPALKVIVLFFCMHVSSSQVKASETRKRFEKLLLNIALKLPSRFQRCNEAIEYHRL